MILLPGLPGEAASAHVGGSARPAQHRAAWAGGHGSDIAAVTQLPGAPCKPITTHRQHQPVLCWLPAQERLGEGGLQTALGQELREQGARVPEHRVVVKANSSFPQVTIPTSSNDLVGKLLSLLPFQILLRAGTLETLVPCTK